MILIDELAYSSKLREKNPGLKMGFSVGTLLICLTAQSKILAMLIIIFMGFLSIRYQKISVFRYLKLLRIPLGFLILGILPIIFSIDNEVKGFFHIYFISWYFSITYEDLLYGVRLFLISMASVSCLYFLSFTTPVLDCIQVLKKCHIPDLLIELFLLIYRYIFVLLESVYALQKAQKSRGCNVSRRRLLAAQGRLLAVVFIRSIKRTSAIYDAMESRCYDGRITVLSEQKPIRKTEIAVVIAAIACFLMIGIFFP